MKIVSAIAKWIVLGATSVVALALLVCVAAYLPPVQNFIKNRAELYLNEQMGMKLDVERLRLRFPLVLRVEKAVLKTANGDTVARMGMLRLGVAPLPLLRGNVQARRLRVSDVAVDWADSTSVIKGTVARLVLDNLRVGMRQHRVRLDRLALAGADLNMHFEPGTDTTTTAAMPWIVSVQRVDLERIAFGMDSLTAGLQTGSIEDAVIDLGTSTYDVQRIVVDDGAAGYGTILGITELSLDARKVHYGTNETRATIEALSLKEQHGVGLRRLSGELEMDAAGAHAHDLRIETVAGTSITADLVADTAALKANPAGQFEAVMDGRIASADITPFVKLPEPVKGRSLELNVDAKGSLNNLTINELSATLEPFAKIDVTGTANVGKTEGALKIDLTANDINVLLPHLPTLPRHIKLQGEVASSHGDYRPDLHMTADEGYATVEGYFNPTSQKYDFALRTEHLPVNMFDVGEVSLTLAAEGEGFDPRNLKSHARIDVAVQRADYLKTSYNDVTLAAKLAEQQLKGRLTSGSTAANLALNIAGSLNPNDLRVAINGYVANLDLQKLGFSTTPLSIKGEIDASASAQTIAGGTNASASAGGKTYTADIRLDSAALTMGDKTLPIDKTTLTAMADTSRVIATLRSGDIYAVLNAREGLNGLTARMNAIADTLTNQLKTKDFRFAAIDSLLPRFNLNMQVGRRNVLYKALASSRMGFGAFSLTASRGDSTSLRTRAVATQFYSGNLMLDTLTAAANIRRGHLAWRLRLANKPGNMEQLAFILLNGTVDGHAATANFQQRNRAGQTGFAFGIEATMTDSLIRASLRPPESRRRRDSLMQVRGIAPARTDSLTFAYEPWGVNKENYIEWRGGRDITANLDLQSHPIRTGVSRKVRLLSRKDDIMLGVSELDIAKALDLLPAPPPLRGMADLQATIGLGGEVVEVNGSLHVHELVWDNRRIGDLAAEVTTVNNGGVWAVEAQTEVNGTAAIVTRGTYDTKGVDFAVEVPHLPLEIANPFIPAGTAVLQGYVAGRFDVEGALNKPSVDGSLSFKQARLTLPMLGTSYGIADRPVRIAAGQVRLRNFALAAPNGRELTVNGTFDIDRMTTDLSISGTNFQVVNASRNMGSQVYGVAAVNADVTIKGALDRLVVRGDIDVLRTTNVTYLMGGASTDIESQKQDVVTFIAFTDSLAMELQALRQRVLTSSIDMQVGIGIEDAVRATINISDNGDDRMELTGGGELALTISDRGEMRLAGRYGLSGGTVVYNPPIPTISQKDFKVRDGSRVEWVGAVMSPQFAITADQTVRTTVEGEGGLQRSVNFVITITIAGTLDKPAITFDLSAPADIAIQNELSSLEPEQRAAQAMALMIYNTYTGPGTTAKVDSNNPVYSFLEKELNQWARNTLRGVDLSLGIRSAQDGAGNQYTNYSYKVSKSLFGDRMRVSVGGSIDNGVTPEAEMRNSFVNDVSLEYRMAQWDNLFLKAYRYNTRKSILEGEVVETGGGVLYRKRVARWRDLFRLSQGPEVRGARRLVRDEERQMWRDTTMRDSLRQLWRAGGSVEVTDSMRAVWRARRDSLLQTADSVRVREWMRRRRDSIGATSPRANARDL